MTLLHRIVELQAKTITRQITDDQAEYDFIEELIDSTKPPISKKDWHYLIATPFRYPLPVGLEYSARFRPPFSERHVFYGTFELKTAEYEFGYHWLRERVHLSGLSQAIEQRTYFTVEFNDPKVVDIRNYPDISKIMDRRNYTYSHALTESIPDISSFLYPSARDPNKGDCIAAFKLENLGKKPQTSTTFELLYIAEAKAVLFLDPSGVYPSQQVSWEQVA